MWSPVPHLAKYPTSDYRNNYHDYMIINIIYMTTIVVHVMIYHGYPDYYHYYHDG